MVSTVVRSASAVAALVLVLGAGGCGRAGGHAGAAVVSPATGTLPSGVDVGVTRVIDGDTIDVQGGERVRLIGMDTPETKDPNRPAGCYGAEASRFTASLLPAGTTVRLAGDVEQRDRYGRLLAYVYRRSDGLFVNAELLRRGFAQLLTIPPNVAHTDEFTAIATRAREATQGLWGSCTLLPDGRVAPASTPGPASSGPKGGGG